MVSDLYWQLFLNDGSAYYYMKYTDALKKEGKTGNEFGPIYRGCSRDKGATNR